MVIRKRGEFVSAQALIAMGKPHTASEKAFMVIVRGLRHIGFGRMMQMISTHWMEQDPNGALAVGETHGQRRNKAGNYRV